MVNLPIPPSPACGRRCREAADEGRNSYLIVPSSCPLPAYCKPLRSMVRIEAMRCGYVSPAITRTRAGHFLQEEVPQEIAAAILDVLARARAN